MLSKTTLYREYIENKRSVADIARMLSCSENKVTYWLHKYDIPKRSISQALYFKHNPDGDPFTFKEPTSSYEWFLYGLGIGLYWGEGNKANAYAVRLGNTDPRLIKKFLEFLICLYNIDEQRIRFGLQVFSDCSPEKAMSFWCKELGVDEKKFQKVTITQSRAKGTYRNKNYHGVLTVYFSNTELRDRICSTIDGL